MLGLTLTELALLFMPPPVYVFIFVPLCRSLLANKAAAEFVLRLRFAHNVLMAAFSFVMTVLAVSHLAQRSWTPHGQLCEEASPAPKLVYAWYASKFAEWIDSMLLLAQNKPLSSLHYNHHATTATVVASHFVGRAVRTSIFDWPLLLNAAVHTLMYAYYAAPSALRPIRKMITTAQICQHVTVLLAILYTSGSRLVGGADACAHVSDAANGLSLGLYLMYLGQFLTFYVRSYISGGGKKKVRRESPADIASKDLDGKGD